MDRMISCMNFPIGQWFKNEVAPLVEKEFRVNLLHLDHEFSKLVFEFKTGRGWYQEFANKLSVGADVFVEMPTALFDAALRRHSISFGTLSLWVKKIYAIFLRFLVDRTCYDLFPAVELCWLRKFHCVVVDVSVEASVSELEINIMLWVSIVL